MLADSRAEALCSALNLFFAIAKLLSKLILSQRLV